MALIKAIETRQRFAHPTGRATVALEFSAPGDTKLVVEFSRSQWRRIMADVQEAFIVEAQMRDDKAAILDIQRWESVV